MFQKAHNYRLDETFYLLYNQNAYKSKIFEVTLSLLLSGIERFCINMWEDFSLYAC